MQQGRGPPSSPSRSQQTFAVVIPLAPSRTPPSSLEHPSPPKRARLQHDASRQTVQQQHNVSSMHQDDATSTRTDVNAAMSSDLRDLPVPIILLTLASSLHSFALAQQPTLTRKPASTRQQQRYDIAWQAYSRSLALSIVVLRRLLELVGPGQESSGMASGRIELRARIMLVECLTMAGLTSEAEKILSKALLSAENNESLAPFRPFLSLLSASLSLSLSSSTSKHSISSSINYTRKTLKRMLTNSPLTAHWSYRTLLTLANLLMSTRKEIVSCWREVDKLATSQGHVTMSLVAKLAIARETLAMGDCSSTEQNLKDMDLILFPATSHQNTNVIDSTKPAPDQAVSISTSLLPVPLQVHYFLVSALFKAHIGDTRGAKDKLKVAHTLLDKPETNDEAGLGEKEGWVKIQLESMGSPTRDQPIVLLIPPKSTIYSFAFLASAAVHRDPFGSKPRSTLFAAEGLKLLDNKLNGSEHLPPSTTLADVAHTLTDLAHAKIHLLLFSAELSLMRSAFNQAEQQYLSAISTARQYSSDDGITLGGNLWLTYKDRITLGMGALYHARGQDDLAEDCFETILNPQDDEHSNDNGFGDKIANDNVDVVDVVSLAKLAFLMLKISQGHVARLSTSSASNLNSTSTSIERRLTLYAQDLSSLSTTSASTQSNPMKQTRASSVELISDIVQALTKGQITKAKQHLSQALNLTNIGVLNHTKALILALLANLFLWTKNEQAQKMLMASAHIAKGMGTRLAVNPSTLSSSTTNTNTTQHQSSIENSVGNAKLGLWVAKKMLETYERTDATKVDSQKRVVEAHQQVVNVESMQQ
ncbi:hypothetical protein OIO90_006128 [Microbotryomycetes sp. JL221]|nr:hypothetical protein OIO90_006128 [Microbotryomycetes sp. JL221]